MYEGVTFPRIPGSDITGEVVETGEGVDESILGKNVVLFPFTSSNEARLEHITEYDGGYVEYVTWPAELCFDMPLPDFTESAVFSVSGLTAWHMVEQIQPNKEEKILVTGANGASVH